MWNFNEIRVTSVILMQHLTTTSFLEIRTKVPTLKTSKCSESFQSY